jgi:hypothetical protein
MINLTGLFIIIIIIIIVIFFRRQINKSNNTFLQGLMKVNDIFNTIKFVLFMLALGLFFILLHFFTFKTPNFI